MTPPAPDVARMAVLLECANLCTKVFYDLNAVDLPEFFEDHMKVWFRNKKNVLCLFVCLFVCVLVRLLVCLFVCLFVCNWLFVCLFVCNWLFCLFVIGCFRNG
jgi:hypothetical protein